MESGERIEFGSQRLAASTLISSCVMGLILTQPRRRRYRPISQSRTWRAPGGSPP
jgi:hypothetical protein